MVPYMDPLYGSPYGSHMDPHTDPHADPHMIESHNPHMDPHMDAIWIPIWIPIRIPIWIPYGSLCESPCGSHMDPYADPHVDPYMDAQIPSTGPLLCDHCERTFFMPGPLVTVPGPCRKPVRTSVWDAASIPHRGGASSLENGCRERDGGQAPSTMKTEKLVAPLHAQIRRRAVATGRLKV